MYSWLPCVQVFSCFSDNRQQAADRFAEIGLQDRS